MTQTLKETIFRLKWLFLSPEEKYAYLWSRTLSGMESEYSGVSGK